MLLLALRSDDELFHITLYSWLMSDDVKMADRLVEVRNLLLSCCSIYSLSLSLRSSPPMLRGSSSTCPHCKLTVSLSSTCSGDIMRPTDCTCQQPRYCTSWHTGIGTTTHSLTHSLIHSLTHSHTHTHTHSHTHTLTHSQ